MSTKLRAHIALIFMTIIFGLHYTVAKNMIHHYLPPLQLVFVRLLGGAILFFLFAQFFPKEKVERKDLLLMAFLGFCGFSANQSLFYEGLLLTSPVDASLIHILNPVVVLLFASILIREKITRNKLGGIFLGASGAVILILYGHSGNPNATPWAGNLLIIANMLFYALYLVLMKPLTARYSATTILKWVCLFGFLTVIPFSAGPMMSISFKIMDLAGWLSLGYIILFCTFFAYILINYGLRYVNASSVSYYTYLQPVLATVSSVSFGMGTITVPKIVAALLIFAGAYVVNKKMVVEG
jgi:drug/metabolite transporter (DMT)-like permease